MIKIDICGMKYDMKNLDRNIIMQQFYNRRNCNAAFWFRIIIEENDINISFSSNKCPSTGYPIQRNLTRKEEMVRDYWHKYKAGEDDEPEGLIKFLDQLMSAI